MGVCVCVCVCVRRGRVVYGENLCSVCEHRNLFMYLKCVSLGDKNL